MRLALLFNLLGTGLLYLSFQATSSTVKIVSTADGKSAMCMGHFAVFVASARGTEIGTGCPDWENGKSIALVTVERPALIYLGFGVLTLGFLLQFLSVPSSRTLAQMRADVKAEEKRQKLAKHLSDLKSNDRPKI